MAWALALCCFFFSNTAHAQNYNDHTFGHDVDYYKDTLLDTFQDYDLTDWQWFPGTGENDGDTTNDHFCLPVYTGTGYEIWYGANGSQSCDWWGGVRPQYQNATYKDFFTDLGTVTMDCSNELNDPSCPGYQEAHFNYMCSTNPLYDQNCPGYQQAYYDQQCSANPLYDQNCPGYSTAYYNQQCEQNPLHDSGCPGYQQAYYEQQCSADALYDQNCPGYQEAYYTNQCSADPLYDSGCQGYQEAYAKQMNEQKQDDGSGVDDGTDDGVPANDGSDIDAFIEPQQTADNKQQTQGFDDGSDDGSSSGDMGDTGSGALKEDEKVVEQQQVQQQETVIEEAKPEVIEQQIIVEQKLEVEQEQEQQQVLVEVEKQIEEIVEQSAPPAEVVNETSVLEEANSLDLDSMSPLQVIKTLNSLGVLGNSATNGVGDPTGLSDSIEGTGGTISATGQTQIPGTSATSNSSSGDMSSGSMSMGDDGSDMGMGQQNMNTGAVADTSSGMSQDGSDFGGDTATTDTTGLPQTQYGFGTVNRQPEVGDNGITNLEADMGLNINPLFDNPALSSGVSEIAGLQEERYSTLASRIIRDRIQKLVEVDNQVDASSVEDAEDLVQQSIEQSIENKMDELMVDANVNQAEIITLMGVNIGFNEYEKEQLANPDLYKDQEFYIDKNIPQNRSALRNGLAQQILHDKMVDMQYEKMNEEKE